MKETIKTQKAATGMEYEAQIGAKVIRANGEVEDLGIVSQPSIRNNWFTRRLLRKQFNAD